MLLADVAEPLESTYATSRCRLRRYMMIEDNKRSVTTERVLFGLSQSGQACHEFQCRLGCKLADHTIRTATALMDGQVAENVEIGRFVLILVDAKQRRLPESSYRFCQ